MTHLRHHSLARRLFAALLAAVLAIASAAGARCAPGSAARAMADMPGMAGMPGMDGAPAHQHPGAKHDATPTECVLASFCTMPVLSASADGATIGSSVAVAHTAADGPLLRYAEGIERLELRPPRG